jgi:TatD DNase family protein
LHDFAAHDVADAVQRARLAGVRAWLLAGVSSAGWARQTALAEQYPECCISYGIHPQLVAELSAEALNSMLPELEERVFHREPFSQGARCVALGETGLDKGTPELRAQLPLQEQLFRAQLALARAADLPVVLHIVDAHGPVLKILRSDGLARAGGVVHSFSGSVELVRDYQALNLHLSFSGSVCRLGAERLARAVSRVDASRLLVETDAPYQTPVKHRPQRNEMAFLPTVIQRIADLRGESFEQVAQFTAANAERLFGVTRHVA